MTFCSFTKEIFLTLCSSSLVTGDNLTSVQAFDSHCNKKLQVTISISSATLYIHSTLFYAQQENKSFWQKMGNESALPYPKMYIIQMFDDRLTSYAQKLKLDSSQRTERLPSLRCLTQSLSTVVYFTNIPPYTIWITKARAFSKQL